jgi:hypothetical protein
MKKALILGIIAIATLGFSSCNGDKGKDSSQIAKEALEALKNAPKETPAADAKDAKDAKKDKDAKEVEESSGIAEIDEACLTDELQLTTNRPTIKDFMATFCAKYPFFKGNEMMLRYLADEAGYKDNSEFFIKINEENGYLQSGTGEQYSSTTTGRVWNLGNGHKLVGIVLDHPTEGDNQERLVTFYSFDPETMKMSPDLNVNTALGEAMKCMIGDFGILLPQAGDNIEFTQIDEKENNKEKVFFVRWKNGTFKFDPKPRYK